MEELKYTNDLELDDKAKNLIYSRKKLEGDISELLRDSKALDNQVMNIRKRISKIDKELKDICEHEWIREPYLYSDLYCKKCGIWR